MKTMLLYHEVSVKLCPHIRPQHESKIHIVVPRRRYRTFGEIAGKHLFSVLNLTQLRAVTYVQKCQS